MTMAKATSAEDYKLISSFESVRKTLLTTEYADRLEKPLAFWALPNDRRLPLAFLGRTLRDLLSTPFEELTATPGIGQKKIASLVKLLHRATKEEPPAIPFGVEQLTADVETEKPETALPEQFDPSVVSESLWDQWRKTVHTMNLGNERLGRLASSLQTLPTVIWFTPLGRYLDYSVAEIRQLKTHGEKRVRVVLEVFYVVHEMLSRMGLQEHVAVRLVPKFILPIEHWIADVLEQSRIPNEEEIRDRLVIPLLDQTKIDVGETVHQLSERRLGTTGNPESVRMQSRRMGVTRARIYQLLDDCSKVMSVRWPEGRRQLLDLVELFKAEQVKSDQLKMFEAARELFYPEKYERLEHRGVV